MNASREPAGLEGIDCRYVPFVRDTGDNSAWDLSIVDSAPRVVGVTVRHGCRATELRRNPFREHSPTCAMHSVNGLGTCSRDEPQPRSVDEENLEPGTWGSRSVEVTAYFELLAVVFERVHLGFRTWRFSIERRDNPIGIVSGRAAEWRARNLSTKRDSMRPYLFPLQISHVHGTSPALRPPATRTAIERGPVGCPDVP